MRTIWPAVLPLLLLGSAAWAQDLPDGVGTVAPSGSVFTSEIAPQGDTDDYVFQGYPGMSVAVTVKLAKGSALKPNLAIVRPGGSLASDDDGLALSVTSKGASAKMVLDASGWWLARVSGLTNSTGGYSVSVKYSSPSFPPLPSISKKLKVSGAIVHDGEELDTDDFEFQGYAGQTFNAQVVVAKTSALDPSLQLIRPDGTTALVAGETDALKKIVLDRSLDATGIWKIRVQSDELVKNDNKPDDFTQGPYTLSAKLGKPVAVGLVPDGNRQYRLSFPAVGGATVGYTLSFKGNAPKFNSFRDPNGRPVAGFVGGLSVKAFLIPPRLPIGQYTLIFDAPAGTPPTEVALTRSLVLPKGAAKRKAQLDKTEPVILNNGINPTEGGPGTLLAVTVSNAVDPSFPDGAVGLFLDHFALTNVSLQSDGRTVRGTVPDDLPEGVFDVVVSSTSGQVAVKADAFRRVPPPVALAIDPAVGTEGGGFEITITGSNFRPGRMGILLEGALLPITPDPALNTETSLTFIAPQRPAGFVVFGVKDLDTQLVANLPLNSFEYVATPAVSRIIPGLIPVLGNELITVQGANFSPVDKVYLETAPESGVYDLLDSTFINSRQHRFTAPPKARGVYRIHVQDSQGQPNPPKTRNLVYYSFADATAGSNLGQLGTDPYDAYTTSLADYDKDGDLDMFLSRRGDPASATASETSLTRVLRNDGGTQFADVTSSVLPEPEGDDWRADRIWVTDVNQDTYPDIAITTDAKNVPAAGKSHTRLLTNEARGGLDENAAERVFRDSTEALMAPPRVMSVYYGAQYTSDDWRGLDMWVGDLDKGPAAPPEIMIVHEEVKDDNPGNGVNCAPYCVVGNGSFTYAYNFYWGGARLFVWDKAAKAGQGRYKFEFNFFPRKAGPYVPTAGPNGQIPPCNVRYNQPCKGAFTPFTGKRIAAGTLDGDPKLDIAVISDQIVSKRAKTTDPLVVTSSLQVAINRFNPKEGVGTTDLTGVVHSMGFNTLGDSVTIGHPGYPDGGSDGVIAFSKDASTGGSSVLRLLKYKTGDLFEDITQLAMPVPGTTDSFQATKIEFRDIDQDGDEDLVLLAKAAPSGAEPALRVYRNERVGTTVGNMAKTLLPLLASAITATEHFEGDTMSIGDVTGDGVIDYVISRATSSGSGPQTRIIRTDR